MPAGQSRWWGEIVILWRTWWLLKRGEKGGADLAPSLVGAALSCAATACAAAALLVHSRMSTTVSSDWKKVEEILRELEEKCATPTQKLNLLAEAMSAEMKAGLESDVLLHAPHFGAAQGNVVSMKMYQVTC
ncbi:hypothetical protein QQ045_001842 [Rhodiola kirilowii]